MMKPVTPMRPLVGAAALVLLLFVTGCGRDQSAAPTPAPATPADPNVVSLAPEMAQRLKTAPPQRQTLANVLQVPGQIEVDEQKRGSAAAGITGRIVEVRGRVGDRVTAGKALAAVASPELTQAQLAYLRAHSQSTLAERAAERARQLLAADVIGSAELQRRESELRIARAELSAMADQLRILGIGDAMLAELASRGKISPSVAIAAPKAGVIIERTVNVGQVVQPGDSLFTVADLSSVWAVGGAPEQDARAISIGQSVEIGVPALGEQVLTGRIVYVADTVNPETRTVTVRTLVDNAQRKLKPAMLATMRIEGAKQEQLVVPNSAVVREANRDHVFVALGNGRYRLTPVELGAAVGELHPVLNGLATDQLVVVNGAFHLNNERKRAELE